MKDHVSTRLDAAIVERLDKLASIVAPLGSTPNRSIVTRACILEGLVVLEAKHVEEPVPSTPDP